MTDPGLVERAVGGAPVELRVAGVAVPAAALGPVTIRHGRRDLDSRPSAATLTAVLDAAGLDPLPGLGATVTVELTAAAVAAFGVTGSRRRFTGRVSDLRVAPVVGVHGPARLTLVAVGTRARLGVLRVGDVPWPVELDGARAGRVLAAAAALDPSLLVPAGQQTPGTVRVLARDVDRLPALRLLDELAADTGGELVETRAGELAWRDAAARTNALPAVTLTARDALARTTWSLDARGMVNRLSVAYGDEPAGGRQAEVETSDPVAAGVHGWSEARHATQLADLAAAASRATEVVGRRSRPRWTVDGLTVELVRGVPPATAGALLGLDQGSLVAVTGLPTTGPTSSSRLWVEGWTEQLTRDHWTLAFDVVDYAAAAPPPRWADVPTRTAPSDLEPAARDDPTSTTYWQARHSATTGNAAGTTITLTREGSAPPYAGGYTLPSTLSNLLLRRGYTTSLRLAGLVGQVVDVAADVEQPAGTTAQAFLIVQGTDSTTGAATYAVHYGPTHTAPASGRHVVTHRRQLLAGEVGYWPGVRLANTGRALVAGEVVRFRPVAAGRVVGDQGIGWSAAPADTSWLGATSWQLPDVNTGRWVDTPADTRWSSWSPPATSWAELTATGS